LKARSAAAVSDGLFATANDGDTSDEDLNFDDDDDDDHASLVLKKKRSTLHPPKHAQYAAGFSDSSSDDDDDEDDDVDDDDDDDTAGTPLPRGNRPAGECAASIKMMRAGGTGNKASKKLPSRPSAAPKPPTPGVGCRTLISELKTTVRARS
jgi:hypothetical protein